MSEIMMSFASLGYDRKNSKATTVNRTGPARNTVTVKIINASSPLSITLPYRTALPARLQKLQAELASADFVRRQK